MLYGISLALSGLKLVSKVNGETISLTPDTLYVHCIEFSPPFSPNATSWSFYLVTLFYNTLNVELQEAIRFDGYTLLNSSTLTTLSYQTSTLQALREKAVIAHKLLCEEKQWVLLI